MRTRLIAHHRLGNFAVAAAAEELVAAAQLAVQGQWELVALYYRPQLLACRSAGKSQNQ